ncbi:ankyrin repeat domain-containing protein [Candidatus Synchoanobacter obligatus]|uniref:Ankyrin repeat domain-containing protein n=1 Tax=Candidatus Synchoanobacter obligatus TaxID=2919597 RepID=A0ABT1L4X2_9GAMM|nr:ankyrin repeat domain-containing protein [Candidatus Synchoanobacter obligatus]
MPINIKETSNLNEKLLKAAEAGHLQVVNALIAAGAEINQPSVNGSSPLFIAAFNGKPDIVVALLQKEGIEVNQANIDGATPLYAAAQEGHHEIVAALIAVPGIMVNRGKADTGETPLYIAAQQGRHKVVAVLIAAQGIMVNQPRTDLGTTPLYIAAHQGQHEAVAALIASPETMVNQASENTGETPLFVAARKGHYTVVEALIAAPDIMVNRATIGVGVTPLYIAAQEGHHKVVAALIAVPGIMVNQARADTGETPLYIAAQQGRHKIVAALIKASGIMVNQARTDIGTTPLYIAAHQGRHKVVAALIKASGIMVNQARTDIGTTPLYIAAQEGHLEVVVALLQKGGIDVNQAREGTGETPLYIAAANGHLDVANALLTAGASVNQAISTGATPLYVAAQNGHADTVEALLAAGFDINQATTNNGITPLYMAALHGNIEAVDALIAAGADVNQATGSGISPLFIAATMGHMGVIAALIEAGGDFTILLYQDKSALEQIFTAIMSNTRLLMAIIKCIESSAWDGRAAGESLLDAAEKRELMLIGELIIMAGGVFGLNFKKRFMDDLNIAISDMLPSLFQELDSTYSISPYVWNVNLLVEFKSTGKGMQRCLLHRISFIKYAADNIRISLGSLKDRLQIEIENASDPELMHKIIASNINDVCCIFALQASVYPAPIFPLRSQLDIRISEGGVATAVERFLALYNEEKETRERALVRTYWDNREFYTILFKKCVYIGGLERPTISVKKGLKKTQLSREDIHNLAISVQTLLKQIPLSRALDFCFYKESDLRKYLENASNRIDLLKTILRYAQFDKVYFESLIVKAGTGTTIRPMLSAVADKILAFELYGKSSVKSFSPNYRNIFNLLSMSQRHNLRLSDKKTAKLNTDRDFVMSVLIHDRSALGFLEFVSNKLQGDKGIVIAALAYSSYSLKFASNALRADKDVVLAAINNDGSALEFASDSLRADKDVVMAAINNDGSALEFASDLLRADEDVTMAAANNDGSAHGFSSYAVSV